MPSSPTPAKDSVSPRKVFLFSGHMIDAPGRVEPRFPAGKEPFAAQAIAQKLDELDAGNDDLAICSGACGGDLLFAEACLKRGLRLELHLPFDVPRFIEESVSFAGASWRDRFVKVCQHANASLLIMTDEPGSAANDVNPFERNNLWMLSAGLKQGPAKLHFICLWNRKSGDGPGGAQHMVETVKKISGHVHILDTNLLLRDEDGRDEPG